MGEGEDVSVRMNMGSQTLSNSISRWQNMLSASIRAALSHPGFNPRRSSTASITVRSFSDGECLMDIRWMAAHQSNTQLFTRGQGRALAAVRMRMREAEHAHTLLLLIQATNRCVVHRQLDKQVPFEVRRVLLNFLRS